MNRSLFFFAATLFLVASHPALSEEPTKEETSRRVARQSRINLVRARLDEALTELENLEHEDEPPSTAKPVPAAKQPAIKMADGADLHTPVNPEGLYLHIHGVDRSEGHDITFLLKGKKGKQTKIIFAAPKDAPENVKDQISSGLKLVSPYPFEIVSNGDDTGQGYDHMAKGTHRQSRKEFNVSWGDVYVIELSVNDGPVVVIPSNSQQHFLYGGFSWWDGGSDMSCGTKTCRRVQEL